MSEYHTGDPVCTCGKRMTAGKPWCMVHDNYASLPPAATEDDWSTTPPEICPHGHCTCHCAVCNPEAQGEQAPEPVARSPLRITLEDSTALLKALPSEAWGKYAGALDNQIAANLAALTSPTPSDSPLREALEEIVNPDLWTLCDERGSCDWCSVGTAHNEPHDDDCPVAIARAALITEEK